MSAINGGVPRGGSAIGVADYIVFGVSLVIPVIISLYFCCIKKQKSNADFLMANRSMSAIPMSFSLCASYMSAVVITGKYYFAFCIWMEYCVDEILILHNYTLMPFLFYTQEFQERLRIMVGYFRLLGWFRLLWLLLLREICSFQFSTKWNLLAFTRYAKYFFVSCH